MSIAEPAQAAVISPLPAAVIEQRGSPAFNLRKALRTYYDRDGATDLMTIGVPRGGYRATSRMNEKPPAAILDDPERRCGQVEWTLLHGGAHDIARIQRYVQHASVRWPETPIFTLRLPPRRSQH